MDPVNSTSGVSNLDETIMDPLKDVERDALTRLRKHEAQVDAFRKDMAAVRARASRPTGSTSIAELRRLIADADKLEALLGVPREVLERETLAEAEWPATDLKQARTVLAGVDACELATARARGQIEESDGDVTPSSLCMTLNDLITSWSELRKTEADARNGDVLAVQRVDLAVEARATTIRLLCDALLDKAIEVHEGLLQKIRAPVGDLDTTVPADDSQQMVEFGQRLRSFLEQEWVQEVLKALQVEVPRHEVFRARSEHSSASLPAAAAAAGGDAARNAPQVSPTDIPARTPPRPPDSEPDVGPEGRAAAAADGGTVDSSKTCGDEDPLLQTTPGWHSSAMNADMLSISRGKDRLSAEGLAELWHAVHVGNQAAVKSLVDQGLVNARLRDGSGHTILWHAIAFDHVGLAKYMLDTFPPGSSSGVDVNEFHARKGDTLLHLLCQRKTFGTQLALIFKRIAAVAPAPLWQRVNHVGFTFMQIAASLLNFWVITFVLRNFPTQAKSLVCMPNHAPLKTLAEVIAQPAPPTFAKPDQFPEHFRVAEMLQQDETGSVPYADVAFDVGPQGKATGRFLAHRMVVASQSCVLFDTLERAPLLELPREGIWAAIVRVDPRISQEVWRSVLQYMYTGTIICPYHENADRVVELLRACSVYKLPKPLLDYAQVCLYTLLPGSPPQTAIHVFSVCCAGSGSATKEGNCLGDPEMRPTREASAYILLRSAHRLFDRIDAKEASQLLERVIQAVEHGVFNPQPRTPASGCAAQAAAPQQLPAQQQQPTSRRMYSDDPLTESLRALPRGQIPQTPPGQCRRTLVEDPLTESLRALPRDRLMLPREAPAAYGCPVQAYAAAANARPPATR